MNTLLFMLGMIVGFIVLFTVFKKIVNRILKQRGMDPLD